MIFLVNDTSRSTSCHPLCDSIEHDHDPGSGSESEGEEELDFDGDWEAMFAIDEEFFNRHKSF